MAQLTTTADDKHKSTTEQPRHALAAAPATAPILLTVHMLSCCVCYYLTLPCMHIVLASIPF
jgi:hypothetical protein